MLWSEPFEPTHFLFNEKLKEDQNVLYDLFVEFLPMNMYNAVFQVVTKFSIFLYDTGLENMFRKC